MIKLLDVQGLEGKLKATCALKQGCFLKGEIDRAFPNVIGCSLLEGGD